MTIAAIVLAGGAGSRFAGDEHKLLVDFRGRPLAAWTIAAVVNASFDQVYVVTGAIPLETVWRWLLINGYGLTGDGRCFEAGNADGVPGPVGDASGPAGDLDPALALGVTEVSNPNWRLGQATSMGVGIERADRDGHHAAVVGLADQPLVNGDAWRAVAEATGPIVTATFDGRRRPPVKLERAVWPLLPRSGDEGARSLIKLRPDLVSEVPCMGNPIDIDTMEDLRKWS